MGRRIQRRETRYVSNLVVWVPSVESLLDMMRYDRCVPATEDESRKLWRILGHNASEADHFVRLTRYAAADTPATAERWLSFNCELLDERSPAAEQLTDAEILKLHPSDSAKAGTK